MTMRGQVVKIEAGEDKDLHYQNIEDDDDTLDLWTCQAIRWEAGGILKTAETGGLLVTGYRSCKVRLLSADTAAHVLPVTRIPYEFWVIDTTGRKSKLDTGVVIVRQSRYRP